MKKQFGKGLNVQVKNVKGKNTLCVLNNYKFPIKGEEYEVNMILGKVIGNFNDENKIYDYSEFYMIPHPDGILDKDKYPYYSTLKEIRKMKLKKIIK